jgi:hypothetical protein
MWTVAKVQKLVPSTAMSCGFVLICVACESDLQAHDMELNPQRLYIYIATLLPHVFFSSFVVVVIYYSIQLCCAFYHTILFEKFNS